VSDCEWSLCWRGGCVDAVFVLAGMVIVLVGAVVCWRAVGLFSWQAELQVSCLDYIMIMLCCLDYVMIMLKCLDYVMLFRLL
jgi:hypothetical protein